MNQKVKQQIFLKYLWLLYTPEEFILVHLQGLGSRSGPRRPGPNSTEKVRIWSQKAILRIDKSDCLQQCWPKISILRLERPGYFQQYSRPKTSNLRLYRAD
jgi:hypothetical protein